MAKPFLCDACDKPLTSSYIEIVNSVLKANYRHDGSNSRSKSILGRVCNVACAEEWCSDEAIRGDVRNG